MKIRHVTLVLALLSPLPAHADPMAEAFAACESAMKDLTGGAYPGTAFVVPREYNGKPDTNRPGNYDLSATLGWPDTGKPLLENGQMMWNEDFTMQGIASQKAYARAFKTFIRYRGTVLMTNNNGTTAELTLFVPQGGNKPCLRSRPREVPVADLPLPLR